MTLTARLVTNENYESCVNDPDFDLQIAPPSHIGDSGKWHLYEDDNFDFDGLIPGHLADNPKQAVSIYRFTRHEVERAEIRGHKAGHDEACAQFQKLLGIDRIVTALAGRRHG